LSRKQEDTNNTIVEKSSVYATTKSAFFNGAELDLPAAEWPPGIG
jgi:hypothetical protein